MERPGSAFAEHAARASSLAAQLAAGRGRPVRLAKSTSNLFRDRSDAGARKLDARALAGVLQIDAAHGTVDAEAMVSYEALLDACLAQGVMPSVVPQLKTITLGGAVAGVAVESSSFREGLVHDTVEEIEVLAGDGRVLVCTATNEHADLFRGFPNSYGTLGYALRVRARTCPAKPFVHLRHERHCDAESYFAAVERHCSARDADFVDGVMFSSDRLYLTLATLADEAPRVSDYTFERIFYRSIAELEEDWLTVRDYLWRWDTDWFWCSKNLLAQQPLVRRLYGRKRLGSRTYQKLMRWNARLGLTRAIDRLRGIHGESVIQDADIPIGKAAEFLAFLDREVGIWPAWMCPIGARERPAPFVLYPMRPGLYVNFGFWDVKRTAKPAGAGHLNRMIEREVERLGGIKSLYSDSYYSPEEFDRLYGGEAYRALKARYDPAAVFPTLYEKCVLRR